MRDIAVPATFMVSGRMEPAVYILASQTRGTLYIGVTSDLPKRIYEHRAISNTGFTARHGVKRLVYIEGLPTIAEAIGREKQLKRWHREWKVASIEQVNPSWRDLAVNLGFAPLNPKRPVASVTHGS